MTQQVTEYRARVRVLAERSDHRAAFMAIYGMASEGDCITARWDPQCPDWMLDELAERLSLFRASERGARVQDIRVFVFLRDGLTCRICDLPIRRGAQVIDHILPVRCGGGNDWNNLRVVHPYCNGCRGAARLSDADVSQRHYSALRYELGGGNYVTCLPAMPEGFLLP
jgi:hypothetical protein